MMDKKIFNFPRIWLVFLASISFLGACRHNRELSTPCTASCRRSRSFSPLRRSRSTSPGGPVVGSAPSAMSGADLMRSHVPVVEPASPCAGVLANPGPFLKLQQKTIPGVIIYEDSLADDELPILVFVGLLSGTEQETIMADSRKLSVKMALQVVFALHPAIDGNTHVSWGGLSRDYDAKAKVVLNLFTYYATNVLHIFPAGVSARIWDNSGTVYQTVSWPHLNAAWSDFSDGITLARVKEQLSLDEIREDFGNFCRYSFGELATRGPQKADALWRSYRTSKRK